MPIWSPTAAEEWGVAEFDKHLVGTGPFLFTEWVPNDHVTFTRWRIMAAGILSSSMKDLPI